MEFLQQNWQWAALAAVSGTWLLVDLVRNRNDKSQVSSIEATLLINRDDAVVIDVRAIGEFEQGHIPNARNFPLSDLERRLPELEKFKNKSIIVYCASGVRSKNAITQMQKAGFEKLFNLRGGMFEWEKAGQPVSKSKKKGKA